MSKKVEKKPEPKKDKKQLEISKSAAMRSTLLAKQMEENENPKNK